MYYVIDYDGLNVGIASNTASLWKRGFGNPIYCIELQCSWEAIRDAV